MDPTYSQEAEAYREKAQAWLPVVASVAARPSLWVVGLRQARRLARPGWWRRPPFVPLPASGYARFRLVTQYGGEGHRAPEVADVLNYLMWCKSCHLR